MKPAKPVLKIEFNTGRHYGPEGQEIVAEVVGIAYDDDMKCDILTVVFHDKTRCIKGRVLCFGEMTQEQIMAAYDKGQYRLV